jgi:hypothetical protein
MKLAREKNRMRNDFRIRHDRNKFLTVMDGDVPGIASWETAE